MLSEIWIAAALAVFTWWFSTGAILIVVRRADTLGATAHRTGTLAALPVLALGLALVARSGGQLDVAGAYMGFLGALAIWGWIELAFLSGLITGPERRPCPPGLPLAERFVRAWWTVAYHELALLCGLLAVEFLTRGAQNDTALWVYLILFVARILAKLNVFFGVPRINTEFVPKPLDHLHSYFRRAPITAMFPVAVTILCFGTACFAQRLWVAEGDGAVVSAALLAALSALALIEHWLMVLPLPDAKLWRWMMPAPARLTSKEGKKHGL